MVVAPKEHRKEVDDVGCVLEKNPKKLHPGNFTAILPPKNGKRNSQKERKLLFKPSFFRG